MSKHTIKAEELESDQARTADASLPDSPDVRRELDPRGDAKPVVSAGGDEQHKVWYQGRLRLSIALLWGAAWIVAIVAILLVPLIRPETGINASLLTSLLSQTAVIWLTPISCLVGFWFTGKGTRSLSEAVVPREKALASLGITIFYLLIVTIVLFVPLYFVDYPRSIEPLKEGTISQRLAETVKFSIMLSPFALGPLNWLTGAAPRDSSQRGQGMKALKTSAKKKHVK